MWLDEAQTVNIASFPLRSIAGELRLDGAPPLYYYLLHVWMGVFGDLRRGDPRPVRASSACSRCRCCGGWFAEASVGSRRSRPGGNRLVAVRRATSRPRRGCTRSWCSSSIAGIGAVQALLSRADGPARRCSSPSSRRSCSTRTTGPCTSSWSSARGSAVVALRGHGARRRGGGLRARRARASAASPGSRGCPRSSTSGPTPARPGRRRRPSPRPSAGSRASSSNESVQAETLSLHLELALLVLRRPARLRVRRAPRRGATDSTCVLTGQPRARVLARVSIGTLARRLGREPRGRHRLPGAVLVGRLPDARHPRRPRHRRAARRAGSRWACSPLVSVLALWTTHWGAHVQRSQAGKVAVVLHQPVPARCRGRRLPRPARSLAAALRRRVELRLPRAIRGSRARPSWTGSTTRTPLAADHAAGLRPADRRASAGDKPFYLVWSVGYGVHRRATTCAARWSQRLGPAPDAAGRGRSACVFYQSMNLLEYTATTTRHVDTPSVANRVRPWTPTSRRRPSEAPYRRDRRRAGRPHRRLRAREARPATSSWSRPTTSSAGSAGPSSATAGGSTSVATASSRRSRPSRTSGTRSSPTRTSSCARG